MSDCATKNFAEFMAGSRAAKFGDFTLKSGKKSNLFIDFGSLCLGAEIAAMGHFFAQEIVTRNLINVDAIFGPAYKGINIAIATAASLWTEFGINLPVSYNRKIRKDHGEGGSFVGYDLNSARSVLVLDDVITDGLTKYETIEMLKPFSKLEIIAFLIGVDREDVDADGNSLRAKFELDTGIRVYSLTTKRELVKCRQQGEGKD